MQVSNLIDTYKEFVGYMWFYDGAVKAVSHIENRKLGGIL